MKIYFACSVRGGRDDADLHFKLVEHLKSYGEVLTEHLADSKITASGESLKESFIHDRDLKWVLDSDVVVAEVSTPSLGVGYELGRAVENKKNILCLFRPDGKKLSAMIGGCPDIAVAEYKDLGDAKKVIDEFLKRK